MYRFLTVDTAASGYDLTTTAAVKQELGILDTSEDTNIATWITQASKAIATYCNRVFLKESVTETFRDRWHTHHQSIVATRFPIVTITSLTVDGTALVQNTDYEVDLDTGLFYRLCNGLSADWRFRSFVASYQAGYDTFPDPVSRAVISLVKLFRATATRDPSLKSENILSGLYSYTLFGASDTPDGVPEDVAALLAPYRNIGV